MASASGTGFFLCRAVGSHKQFQYEPYKPGRSERDHSAM